MNLKAILLIIPLLFLTSCQSQRDLQADSAFPKQMVGLWEAYTQAGPKWGISIEPDGSINKISHVIAGDVDVATERGVYREYKAPNSYGMFAMGDCRTIYDPAANEVLVEIGIDEYEVVLPVGTLKGRSKDYFAGTVSKDGKTWQAKWRSHNWLEGAKEPDIEHIDANPIKLLFTKMPAKD